MRASRLCRYFLTHIGPPSTRINCASANKYSVVVEHISTRLSEMSSLRPLNAIILLRSALKGYQYLSRSHGMFSVN